MLAKTRMEFGADLPQDLIFFHRLTSESLDCSAEASGSACVQLAVKASMPGLPEAKHGRGL